MANQQRKPHTIPVGRGVKAKVWTNDGKNGPWYTASFARTYKNEEGQLQDADSYTRDDLLFLAFAVVKAFNHINEQLAKPDSDE